jgi:4-amino-4-deoxy-L-arabinose transferase-like glycosyltransferase
MQNSAPSIDCRRVGKLYVAITALKILLILGAAGIGKFTPFMGDNAKSLYLPIAQRILEEQRFNGPDSRADSKVPIGYPAFLAGCEWLVGEKYFLVLACCLQMGADFGVAGILYWMGCRLTNPRAAALAGVIWLVFPPTLVIATWITAENLFTLLLIASLAVLMVSLSRWKAWEAGWAGIIMGVATLFRGTTIFLPIFLLPLWLRLRRERGIEKGLALLAGLAIVVFPWMMRNRIVLHDSIPVATGFGSAFLQGSDPSFFTISGKDANYPEAFAQAAADGIPQPGADDRESIKDRYLLKVGIDQYRLRLRERPLSFVTLGIEKARRLWYGTETGRLPQEFLLGVMSLCIVPLGLWRIFAWRKTHRMIAAMLGGVILYFLLLHWVSLPEYRYVHPIMPLLVLGAAEAFESFFYECRQNRSARTTS